MKNEFFRPLKFMYCISHDFWDFQAMTCHYMTTRKKLENWEIYQNRGLENKKTYATFSLALKLILNETGMSTFLKTTFEKCWIVFRLRAMFILRIFIQKKHFIRAQKLVMKTHFTQILVLFAYTTIFYCDSLSNFVDWYIFIKCNKIKIATIIM